MRAYPTPCSCRRGGKAMGMAKQRRRMLLSARTFHRYFRAHYLAAGQCIEKHLRVTY